MTKVEPDRPIHASWCTCGRCFYPETASFSRHYRRQRRIVRAQAAVLILAAVGFILLLAACAPGIAGAFQVAHPAAGVVEGGR